MKRPLLILVSGASGSGKTTFCSELYKKLSVFYKGTIISQDDFYFDKINIPMYNNCLNYDHPNSFDWKTILDTIHLILNNEPVKIYKYDFTKSEPTNDYYNVDNNLDFIILEGLYTLYNQEINNLASLKIFIDTDLDECIIRRIMRDTKDRKRPIDTIIERWRKVVRPMYKLYVEPTKFNSDIIIPWYDNKEVAIQTIKESLIEKIKNEKC